MTRYRIIFIAATTTTSTAGWALVLTGQYLIGALVVIADGTACIADAHDRRHS
ncbi:hypothetical protein [Rhodococcus phage REQ2]|uniref:Uncharacterized protein n=1 Tax=Rhodococcus phage REQ2 TaxID=1109713 RepID=G9FH18_9CAUD|nr:hypothetical protein RoPhREQ2_gp75 [Rhodococcus phage REQ2]AEV51929.1 hypothetical protein [Rhodococcus phage REQ2]